MVRTKKTVLGALFLTGMTLMSGCAAHRDVPPEGMSVESMAAYDSVDYGEEFTLKPLIDRGYKVEEVLVELPGLTESYDLLFISDLHVIAGDDEVSESDKETVAQRIKSFSPDGGNITSDMLWQGLPTALDQCNSDMILFGGDMCDFGSKANVTAVTDGISRLNTPHLVTIADHDYCSFYLSDNRESEALAQYKEIGDGSSIFYADLGQVIVLVYNYSTGPIPDDSYNIAQQAYSIGKPVIMLTHVPLDSLTDASLDEASREVFDRNLTWSFPGKDSYYVSYTAGETSLLSSVYAQDGPVSYVLSGHLHFSWDGNIADTVREHVFSPAFQKNIGYIKIRGAE